MNYSNDSIQWNIEKRLHMKLVMWDEDTCTYKLKNTKNPSGIPVMRRQLFKSEASGWIKHEYKLFSRKTQYREKEDGTVDVSEIRNVLDYPVVVHYYRSSNFPRKKRKYVSNDMQIDNSQIVGSYSPTMNYSTQYMPMSQPISTPYTYNNSYTDNNSISRNSPNVFSPGNSGPMQLEILHYSPDTVHATDETTVIFNFHDPNNLNGPNLNYTVEYDGKEIPCQLLGNGMIKCTSPHHMPGIVYLRILCRNVQSNQLLQTSNMIPFYYTPADVEGKLSLAYVLNGKKDKRKILSRFRHSVRNLDLSYNQLSDISILQNFYHLQTLILDNNQITEHTTFPHLPSLKNLSVNCNFIVDIEEFLNQIAPIYPTLQYLTTMYNSCCPLFHEHKHHYYNYRIYVLSRLLCLQLLDETACSAEERKHASFIISSDNHTRRKEELSDNSHTSSYYDFTSTDLSDDTGTLAMDEGFDFSYSEYPYLNV
eukprot:TRINITY_DN1854_c1_g1_i2.p1 TRINITY_DN1854_c1_g1~~TRINITY_DN1854_c1_g1_i2.p1  ORF type:complete len:479 (+),score=77.14 TRINITY_DN1854_c1_g1_i2:306-1742(+)